MNLNELSKECHYAAVKKGFYNDYHQHYNKAIQSAFFAQRIALIHSELSEALEADRKSKYADLSKMQPDIERFTEIFKNSHARDLISADEPFKQAFEDNIKDTVEDELADTLIRIFDLCGFLNIDIQSHVELKMKYNETRPEKHGKEY